MANIRGRCKNENEFRAVKSALEEAGHLLGFIPERITIICRNNSEALRIVRQHAPSGLTQTGMGFI